MNIMATYRGAVVVVAAAKIYAKNANIRGNVMWRYLSPVRSDLCKHVNLLQTGSIRCPTGVP